MQILSSHMSLVATTVDSADTEHSIIHEVSVDSAWADRAENGNPHTRQGGCYGGEGASLEMALLPMDTVFLIA